MTTLTNYEAEIVALGLQALENKVHERHARVSKSLETMPKSLREQVGRAFYDEAERIYTLRSRIDPALNTHEAVESDALELVDAPMQSVGGYCRQLTGADV